MGPAMTSRLPNWPHRLNDLVQQQLNQPFRWGRVDCALWVADVCLALTGADLLIELRKPKRRTAWAALRALRQLGGAAQVMWRAGLPPVAPALASRGDLVLIGQGRWPVLGVCLGDEAMAPGAEGLECVPMARVLEAWKV